MIKQPTDLELFQQTIKPGIGGLSNFNDPEDIEDNECPDILNIVFDDGIAMPRKGQRLYATKPSGETGTPSQIMKVSNSIGEEFLIVVYQRNFYLFDETNERFVKLNHTWTPTYEGYYGYSGWNDGLGDDRLYFCNGRDSVGRWTVALGTLASDALAGATTITLDDAVPFPTSGTLVISDGSTTITEPYSSKAGNVITLTNTLDSAFSAGSSVTMMIEEKSSMEKGKVLLTSFRRLIIISEYQNEVKLAYSDTNDPETLTTGTNPSDGGILTLNDGNGGLVAGGDFGSFFLAAKENNLIKVNLDINDAGDEKIERVDPLISGQSLGPLNNQSTIKVLNSVYYPTRTNGIIQLTPTQTGQSATSGVNIISKKIFNYVKRLNFDNARVAHNDQKIYWLCGTGDVNNLVLVYDILRDAWTKFNDLSAADVFSLGNNLYALSRIDGNVYQVLVNYDDNGNDYEAYFFTKQFNFGKPAITKTSDSLFLDGLITKNTKLYIDVLLNNNGELSLKTYLIDGSNDTICKGIPAAVLSQYPMGVLPLGLSEEEDVLTFRCYLGLEVKNYYNIQARVYSQKAGSIWGVTNMAFNPVGDVVTDAYIKLSPIN